MSLKELRIICARMREALFFVLLLSVAMFGSSDGDRCANVDVSERVGEGCAYVDASSCTLNGCCWDDDYDSVTYPSQCGADTVGADCWGNSNQNDCEAFGCCWDTSNSNHCYFGSISQGKTIPRCFHGKPTEASCLVANEERVNCNQLTRSACESAGCCWNPVD